MNSPKVSRPLPLLLFLSVCLVFVAIGGFYGGISMLQDPNGSPMKMPVDYLKNTIFQNFTIPGLFLIGVWGIGSFVMLYILWARPKLPFLTRLTSWSHEYWGWDLLVLMGVGLLVWLVYQLFTIPEMAPIQVVMFVIAFILIGVPLLRPLRVYYHE